MKNKNLKESKGITLIALVITIIVLLILAAVSIATLTGENGILTKAQSAKNKTEEEQLKEMVKTDILGYQSENKSGEITAGQLRVVLNKYFRDVPEKAEDLKKNLENEGYSLKAKEEYGKNIEIKLSELYKGNLAEKQETVVTVGGEAVILTEENVKEYLGKVVTNFKENYEGEETLNIGTENYIVSKKYRLYYVDFTNKYGDGEGTIYLKADCTSNENKLQLDETDADEKNSEGKNQVKIKQLNPGLYETGKTAPNKTNPNMQKVTWLLNENNWASLKNGVKIAEEDINYIVGAPSLEMMIDSYNTKYADVLTGKDKPDLTEIKEGERRKLFYQYNNGYCGYWVGPSKDGEREYGEDTPINSVQTDSKIDTMYYPGDGNYYWLGTPSLRNSELVRVVYSTEGGKISDGRRN